MRDNSDSIKESYNHNNFSKSNDYEDNYNDEDDSKNKKNKGSSIVKWLYIFLFLFLFYIFYHKITTVITNYFLSNPSIYTDYLYFSTQITNSTLAGLFYISILGALFFLAIPMEAIFIYYLTSTFHSALFIVAIIVVGGTIGLSINYFMGWILGGNFLKKMFEKKTYEKYGGYITKYGAIILVVGNILPSPIEPLTLFYGSFNYSYKKFFILSLIGRLIKYLIFFIAFYFFWDQITFFWDDLMNSIPFMQYL